MAQLISILSPQPKGAEALRDTVLSMVREDPDSVHGVLAASAEDLSDRRWNLNELQPVREALAPGGSALLLLIDNQEVAEQLLEDLAPFKGDVLRTPLDKSQEARVRAACAWSRTLGASQRVPKQGPVDEAHLESFPASDPPSFNPGRA